MAHTSTPALASISRFGAAAPAVRRIGRIALAATLALGALGLAGCTSSHPVTKAGEACASCHSDGRAAAVTPEVYLCTASIADTGTVVPARMRTIPASEFGAVTVSEPGLYALCAGDTSSPSATVLINATDSGDAIANVRV